VVLVLVVFALALVTPTPQARASRRVEQAISTFADAE
jgi:hypothetical protein